MIHVFDLSVFIYIKNVLEENIYYEKLIGYLFAWF